MPRVNNTSRATILILCSACAFGALSTLAVLAQRNDISLINAMAWRFALGSLFLLYPALRAIRTSVVPLSPKSSIRLAVLGAAGQATITFTTLYSLKYITVGLLAFLFFTYPAWLALISTVRRTEPLTPTRTAALAISLAGLAIMAGPALRSGANTKGVLIALGAAILYAMYLPALRYAQQDLPPMLATFLLVAGATMSFVVVGILRGELARPSTSYGWVIVLILGVVCTFIAFTAFLSGLRVLGAVRTSIIATIEPFFTALLGATVLLQPLHTRTVIGGAMVVLAVVLLQLRPDAIGSVTPVPRS